MLQGDSESFQMRGTWRGYLGQKREVVKQMSGVVSRRVYWRLRRRR